MRKWLYFIIPLVFGLIFFTFYKAHALDRCETLIRTVRVEHTKYFGIQFPSFFGLGQLKQESACRTNITSFDGGLGVSQMMPKTAQYIQSLMGEKLNPYNARDAIRMQAFYMQRIHTKENWSKKLWISYQIYNSGRSVLRNEYLRAGSLDWEKMKSCCKRKKVVTPSGYALDFCVSGYDYSKKIYKYGLAYKGASTESALYPYW